jgi:hypothetical protein
MLFPGRMVTIRRSHSMMSLGIELTATGLHRVMCNGLVMNHTDLCIPLRQRRRIT